MGIKNIIGELTLNGKQVATVDQLPNVPKTPSKGLVYALSEDGTSAACTGFGTCTETDIVIASEYEGKPVTSISDSVFSYRTFTSIVLPKGITSIGANAFVGCLSLERIVIPDSVTSIGNSAFDGCMKLASITIPDSVTSIGEEAFDWCSSLERIVIPEGVTSIGKSAFINCSSLTIYCKVTEQPAGWVAEWNPDNRPVVWGAALDFPAVNDQLIYTNDKGRTAYTVGGIKEGFDFSKGYTISQILNKIFFPFTEIEVTSDSEEIKMCSKSGDSMDMDSKSTIPTYRTLGKVTLKVAPNDTTGLEFYLEDTTTSPATVVVGPLSEENISSNILTFTIPADKQVLIETPRSYQIRYSYLEEDGKTRCTDKTIDLGEFGLEFKAPSAPSIKLKNSDGAEVSNFKVGQSCSVGAIDVSVSDLNSAIGDDEKQGINKFILIKDFDPSFSKEVDSKTDKKTGTFTLDTPDEFAPTYNLTTETKEYKYTVEGRYNKRSTTDKNWVPNGGLVSNSKTITFEFEPATVTLTLNGIFAENRSKLDPFTISENSLSATLTKNSDKINSVSLLVNNGTAETIDLTAEDNFSKTAYDSTSRNKVFNYAVNNCCTSIKFKVTADCASGEKSTTEQKVTFSAPYCYGFLRDEDKNIAAASVTANTLKNLDKFTQSTSEISRITLDKPGAQKKVVFAVPTQGKYNTVYDNTTGYYIKNGFDVANITLTFADESTQGYQIFISKTTANANIDYSFS